jgi:hypothetical protein
MLEKEKKFGDSNFSIPGQPGSQPRLQSNAMRCSIRPAPVLCAESFARLEIGVEKWFWNRAKSRGVLSPDQLIDSDIQCECELRKVGTGTARQSRSTIFNTVYGTTGDINN